MKERKQIIRWRESEGGPGVAEAESVATIAGAVAAVAATVVVEAAVISHNQHELKIAWTYFTYRPPVSLDPMG